MECHVYLKPKHFKVNQSLKSYYVAFVLKEIEHFYWQPIHLLFEQTFTFLMAHLPPPLSNLQPLHLLSFTFYTANPLKIQSEIKQTQKIKHCLSDLFPSSLLLCCLTFLRSWNHPKLNVTSAEPGQSRWTVNIY